MCLIEHDLQIQPSKEGMTSTMGLRIDAPKLLALSGDQPCTGSGFSMVSLNGISRVRERVLNLSPICDGTASVNEREMITRQVCHALASQLV